MDDKLNKARQILRDQDADDTTPEPVKRWSVETDPAILSGDRWADQENDLGHNREENEELLEKGITPGARFMHPMHDASYRRD